MANLDIDHHMTEIYDFKRRIGKGAYGIVWKAIDKRTREIVAVKKIFDAFKNKTDAQRTYREITFLRAFGVHNNIIRLKGVHKANNNLDIYLVFEYMDTDLHNVIIQRGILSDIHKRYIMYQLLNATKYIHSGNVVHRDQKPSNILIDKQCHCKLADFGLARSLSVDNAFDGGDNNPLTDYVATRWYRPPEVLVASKRYTQGIDMWSLGCILAEMLLGRAIFPGSSTVDQVERVLTVLGPPSAEDIRAICSSGVGVGLLSRAPRTRIPLRDLLRGHPQDAIDLVTKLLVLNPEKRLSAREALKHSYVQMFRGNSPTLSQAVLPSLPDDCQWSIDEYRTHLYELICNKDPPRYEEQCVPRLRSCPLTRTQSQQVPDGVKNLRGRTSSHQNKWPSVDPVTRKTPEMTDELRKNGIVLPRVEATKHTTEQNRQQCKCKKTGCHRSNIINAPYKTVVPEVVPQGPKLHDLNRAFRMAPAGFLPRAASTPF